MFQPCEFRFFLAVNGNPVGFTLFVFRALSGEKYKKIVFFGELVGVFPQAGENIYQGRCFFGIISQKGGIRPPKLYFWVRTLAIASASFAGLCNLVQFL